MKKRSVLCSVAVAAVLFAKGEPTVSFMEPLIVPAPVSLSVASNRLVHLNRVAVSCKEGCENAVRWAAARSAHIFGAEVTVTSLGVPSSPIPGGDEAYELTAEETVGVRIRANTLSGVRHAFSTLRQSVMAERGVKTTARCIMPEMTVKDYPALEFRGIHLCWFPGIDIAQMERHIRMAAYYKFNFVVVEPWAVYRWRKHPDFCWPDASVTFDDCRRLARIGRELGVAVCPQLNIFGHAAMSRFVGGKHATLDLHPRYQPLFEPLGGWNWCLTNPETVALLRELVDDLHEAFDRPEFFHIGCDEAHEPSCPSCRAADYAACVANHIGSMRDFLSERGARAMMWHDMLLSKDDPRWKGFYAKGGAHASQIAAALPKDIYICDWFYEGPKKSYPTLDHFKALGFDVLACPWQNPAGIAAQGAAAREKRLAGMLATTWHRAYGRRQAAFLIAASHAGWGTSPARYAKSFGTITVATHLRQIGWEMPLKSRFETGFVNLDVPDASVVDPAD